MAVHKRRRGVGVRAPIYRYRWKRMERVKGISQNHTLVTALV